ncbi:protein downstream neighbor of son homolog isoform X1 [Drosophila mauritiana]|uniref:Protein downstream neighbor of son homolog isoform X1 n=1 Tax=Drosophila mauritiana TaxID=7226 RepID=A0A6P8KMJ6_DROMA|nr:protein downstream neighbor of son homolog isoform X1 [Drosophila mauritiana]
MSSEASVASKWTRPDDFIKLQRLKQKKNKLAARVSNNNNRRIGLQVDETDKSKLLEAKLAQKRKNPFAKSTDDAKKLRVDPHLADLEPVVTASSCFVRETPTRPPPAKFVLQKYDPQAFAKLFQQPQITAEDEDDAELAARQKHTAHLPVDWSLKTRARFFCPTELPAIQLKTSQLASGLTSFVRCMDPQRTESTLDISDATRFNQCNYYWQHPHLPWLTLYPRTAKENVGVVVGERERKALAEEWDFSFRGLFQLLRARQCPYFYLCANTFTVLFRAAGVGGRAESHALVTPSTRGMRQALRQEGIEFSMPLKSEGSGNAHDSSFTEESTTSSLGPEAGEDAPPPAQEDEDDDDDWLESLGVDERELRRIQSSHARKQQAAEMREDFSDNSLLLVDGVECQGFFSYLLNAKSAISTVGRLAGVPPTLLSPVAFPKATMQHLVPRSKKVRLDGVDYFSIDIKGLILPTFLPSVAELLSETRQMFSSTLASSINTLAFSKATQKLLETPEMPQSDAEGEDAAGQVFGEQNLSECGLLPGVVGSICRTGQHAVGLLERVCYQRDEGYAWS